MFTKNDSVSKLLTEDVSPKESGLKKRHGSVVPSRHMILAVDQHKFVSPSRLNLGLYKDNIFSGGG